MKLLVEGKDAGLVFEIHPETSAAFELNGKAAIFDIDLNALYNAEKSPVKFTELQKFPEVPFEISVLADRFAYSGDIQKVILKSDQKHVKEAAVISTYEGAPIPEGKKSVSLRVVFASKEKTLEPAEIEALQKKVIADITKNGYALR